MNLKMDFAIAVKGAFVINALVEENIKLSNKYGSFKRFLKVRNEILNTTYTLCGQLLKQLCFRWFCDVYI